MKSKRQWARPDRPGSWGQRRDSIPHHPELRKMRSEVNVGWGNIIVVDNRKSTSIRQFRY